MCRTNNILKNNFVKANAWCTNVAEMWSQENNSGINLQLLFIMNSPKNNFKCFGVCTKTPNNHLQPKL